MKKFIVKSVLAVCITFCCLFYLDMMYEQKVSTGMSEVNVFNFVPHNIQLANTGSSHGQCAFNWDALANERGYETFNFALTSQSFLYDYSLINMHKDDFADGSILFIPISYFSFNEEATDPADQEAISVRYYRILSPRYNPDYSLYKDLVTVRFPILSAGDEIFELFKPPIIFPSLSENKKNITYAAEAGMADAAAEAAAESPAETAADTTDGATDGAEAVSETLEGTADAAASTAAEPTVSDNTTTPADTNTAESATSETGTAESATPEEIYGAETVAEFEARGLARYQRHFENKDEYFEEEKKQYLIDLITLCKENNITPVLITTPFTVYYNQYVSADFLYEFYTVINDIALEYGVSYYDYSHDERFQTNLKYFGDADHLNPDGAVYFTGLLTEEVAELKAYLAVH
ncbi:MAG TPA: hypothetical protein H9744_15525 [Candidatus Eisenbergiella stercoravium]|nr:hypothetical protein [Candidatus Eisenbergiella stercoravium]